MSIFARIIQDSLSPNNDRLTTFHVRFHRFILAEFNTHRAFSRNFSSSRAIPIQKIITQVRTSPAMPVQWGKNQSGMQAHEQLESKSIQECQEQWLKAAEDAANHAERLSAIGLHKQITNRILEPFMWCEGIVSSTEWDNFFALRGNNQAQPEIQVLAQKMKELLEFNVPKQLNNNEWHLPYVTLDEIDEYKNHSDKFFLQKLSAARCCRVSYLRNLDDVKDINADLILFEKLVTSNPIHASPLEHQAIPNLDRLSKHLEGNFFGWNQFRHVWVHNEKV